MRGGARQGWLKTKPCGAGAKTPSFGPAPPHCHPSCSTHSFSSRSYLFNFLFPLCLFLIHTFNFFISKNARYTKIYTNFVTCCEQWKCIHMVNCGKSCISFVVLAIQHCSFLYFSPLHLRLILFFVPLPSSLSFYISFSLNVTVTL